MDTKNNKPSGKENKIKKYFNHVDGLVESSIYLRERGGLAYKVRIVIDHKEHIQYFDNIQEARAYRDKVYEEKFANKSILKKRRRTNTLPRHAEIIEKFISAGVSTTELSKEYNLSIDRVCAILQQYYKPQDGVEIIVQSKINGVEDPDKIKNITFL